MLLAKRPVKLDPPELGPQAVDPSLELLGARRPDREGDRAAKKRRAVRSAEPALELAGVLGSGVARDSRAMLPEGLLLDLLVGIDQALSGEPPRRRIGDVLGAEDGVYGKAELERREEELDVVARKARHPRGGRRRRVSAW